MRPTGSSSSACPLIRPLIGESIETGNTSAASTRSGQSAGQRRGGDVRGRTVANQTQVDWYSFTVDHQFIQAIPGLNDGGKTISAVFDIDYSDGRSVPIPRWPYSTPRRGVGAVARDSNVKTISRSRVRMDLPDLSRGSVGRAGSLHRPGYVARRR